MLDRARSLQRYTLRLSGQTIKQSPEYTEQSLVTREYESRLHRHYEGPGYWVGDRDPTDQIQ